MPVFISNHGMRMVEASLRCAGLDGLELRVWDLMEAAAEELAREIIDFDPDVVGFSAYIWSFPFFVEVARRVKEDDPGRLIVFGGPSARPSMLGQAPFRAARGWIDALVINDGELTFAEIVRSADRSAQALTQVQGIALPAPEGWMETPARPAVDLNEMPSPYQMDLVPHGGLAVLQTYRGCPFTCSFCEWGTLESPRRVRGVEELCLEFDGMARQPVDGAILVDAGLNLNPHSFRNLRAATERHGFLAGRSLICEVYPAKVKKEHIDFLGSVGQSLVGIGLQSFDNEVLAHVERSYDEARFEQTMYELKSVAAVAVEIILGLPGDTPENFRKSFERARSLPCALRVYHCVVLPSALMVRAPASYAMDYDPVTLKMRSCLGWTEQQLQAECDYVTRCAQRDGGRSGQYFWIFPPPGGAY
ncbi:MAG: B12-binding domain-containing radical SAM protein [Proteobacteria bacterium]|nr:B12-binding domain-containing radical SAM protein [Pseudomonadota bacterium]